MRLVIASFLVVGMTNANAYSVYGATGCGKLITSLDVADKKEDYESGLLKVSVYAWIAGYITAYNSLQEIITKKKNANVIETTDISGVWQSVLNYCKANPLHNINDAMVDTIVKLDSNVKRKRP
jgi:hypothetical protein